MKGKLTKHLEEWGVLWDCAIPSYAPSRQWTPLHPDDVKQIEQDSLVFDNIDARIATYPDVEFHFYELWEQVDDETEVTKYAKLGPVQEQTNGDRFDEFMRTVEGYPELEGTMNLCEDIIKGKGELRYKDGTPIRSYYSAKIQELLDEISVEDRIRYEKLETLAKLLAKTWFYGDWKWETPNERAMQMLMQELGYYPFADEDEMIRHTQVDENLHKQAMKEIPKRG